MRTILSLMLLAFALVGSACLAPPSPPRTEAAAPATAAPPEAAASVAATEALPAPPTPTSPPRPRVEPTASLESAELDEVLARSDEGGAVELPAADEPAGAAPEPLPAASAADDACDRPPPPLPAHGTSGADGFWEIFRTPLPPAPVWNPAGPKRVGLQVGHWRTEEVPPELGRLGGGSAGGGKAEWEVNLDVARRVAARLEPAGVVVDVLPATIPPRYRAQAFLALHADGDESGQIRGYKLARAIFSATPEADDALLASLYDAYGRATGLPRDDEHVSRRMTGYYAFNSRRYCSAIAPGTPGAIIEMGFLTSAPDRQVLLGNPDAAAEGIAQGLLRYLGLAGS